MAGTANDYIGTLSTTRSGRTCSKWLSDDSFKRMQETSTSLTTRVSFKAINIKTRRKSVLVEQDGLLEPFIKPSKLSGFTIMKSTHNINQAYLNDSLYPEHSVQKASNYCRDPSRNIAGTWCYTTDPLVPLDLCDVRDCEKSGKV